MRELTVWAITLAIVLGVVVAAWITCKEEERYDRG